MRPRLRFAFPPPQTETRDTHAERSAAEKMQPVYEKRRPVVKAIAKFWPVALMNHEMFAIHCQHNLDQVALAYLEDLWVVRHPKEFRAFTLEFVRPRPLSAESEEHSPLSGSTSRRTRSSRTRC